MIGDLSAAWLAPCFFIFIIILCVSKKKTAKRGSGTDNIPNAQLAEQSAMVNVTELRRYSDVQSSKTLLLQDTENGGFLPFAANMGNSEFAKFEESATDFTAFGNLGTESKPPSEYDYVSPLTARTLVHKKTAQVDDLNPLGMSYEYVTSETSTTLVHEEYHGPSLDSNPDSQAYVAASGGGAPTPNEEMYVDLSNDPVAQRAARASMSFASKSDKSAAEMKSHSVAPQSNYEDMSNANVPKGFKGRSLTSMPEPNAMGGGEMYVDMKALPDTTTPTIHSGEMYVDMQALPNTSPKRASFELKGMASTSSDAALPAGFIPPTSSVKRGAHDYVNTATGAASADKHTYVNTNAAQGAGVERVNAAHTYVNTHAQNNNSMESDDNDDVHTYANTGAAAATAAQRRISAPADIGDHVYGNVAVGTQAAFGAIAEDEQGNSVDNVYVNNEQSRAAFALTLPRGFGRTVSENPLVPAAVAHVVAVPSQFYSEIAASGTDHSSDWIIAPLDVARYKALDQNRQPHTAVPECVRNKIYNRHLDVLPNPVTRVGLSSLSGDATSSYINANFVRDGSGNKRAYIATQAPQEATIIHFWRMIWEHKVTGIVMATGLVEKGEEKCQAYWPSDVGDSVTFLDLQVTLEDIVQCDGYTRNVMVLEQDGETRQLIHWWFTAWPDHGVPKIDGRPDPSHCLHMMRDVRASQLTGPLVVHCSAGVGRSGSLIAMDICMSLLDSHGRVDPAYVVFMIRHDRVALVQHPQQYELLHASCLHYASLANRPCREDIHAVMF